MKLFLNNQAAFHKQYVLGQYNDRTSPSALEGVTFHKFLEQGIREVPSDEKIIALMEELSKDKTVNWGKTGSFDKSAKCVANALSFFFEEVEMPENCECEVRMTSTLVDHEGVDLPIPFKGIIDRIHVNKNGENVLTDYKMTIQPTLPGEYNLEYVLQAIPYFLLMRAANKPVAYMEFLQIKKSKNKDGSPQVVPYMVTHHDVDTHHKAFATLVRLVYEAISGRVPMYKGQQVFLPNPFEEYNGEEAWQDFITLLKT